MFLHQPEGKKRKKGLIQRHAHLSSIPDDVMGKIAKNYDPRMNPSFFSSSLPMNQHSMIQHAYSAPFSLPKSIIRFKNSNAKFQSQTVLINNIPRDINDVIHEIVTSRAPAKKVTVSSLVSVVCPLSMIPITAPGRGLDCNHAQCFDLRQFILFQLTDDWKCPICQQSLDFESLRFDPFFFKSTQTFSPIITSHWEDFTMDITSSVLTF